MLSRIIMALVYTGLMLAFTGMNVCLSSSRAIALRAKSSALFAIISSIYLEKSMPGFNASSTNVGILSAKSK